VRNILKLSVTLAVVGIISAALLTGVYNVTAPIIAERQETEYRQALELYFPGFASYDSEEIGEDLFDLIYDNSDNLIGIMGTIGQQGYDGTITYNLALDDLGSIIGVRVVSHTETPGIGDIITTDGFQEQFIGKNYEDPIVAGDDVDAVTGATVSSSAMINSIRRVTGVVAENFLGVESEVIDIAAVPDGTYQGSAPGLGGELTVEVEVSGGVIISIEVIEHNETPTYFIEAYPLIPEQIIAEQHFDVDTQTGATISAVAIIEAVQNALREALGIEVGEEPEEEPVDINISEIPDGIYEGSGEGFYGPITVEVEVSGGQIVSIVITGQDETPEYFRESNPLIPERIIEEQSLDIDTSTGATFSAKGIVEAVLNALNSDSGGED
jgi:RnfABCDGE-type electron transport complex G subunit